MEENKEKILKLHLEDNKVGMALNSSVFLSIAVIFLSWRNKILLWLAAISVLGLVYNYIQYYIYSHKLLHYYEK